MIPSLNPVEIHILNHLANFRNDGGRYVPYGVTAHGVCEGIRHPHPTNMPRYLHKLASVGLLEEVMGMLKSCPSDKMYISKRGLSRMAWFITEDGRHLVDAFRKVWPKDLSGPWNGNGAML